MDRAYSQVIGYFQGLSDNGLPKYVVVSDFNRIRLYDLDDKTSEFLLKDFYKNIHFSGFVTGYNQKRYRDEPPVNIKAAEMMGSLHDALKES